MRTFSVLAAATALLMAATASAQDFKPAVIFDMGGRFDGSFNEAANAGAERFRAETGVDYEWFEVSAETQREQALRTMPRRGATVVSATGFAMEGPLRRIAAQNPDTKFCIIDAAIDDMPNVRSRTFKEHEGSFLVGMLAARKAENGVVGFIGGMDIPLIRNFAYGYEQGAKYVNPDIEVLVNMTGTTPAAWNDPVRGSELAMSQISRGANVVYAAAGGTGKGVLDAAADAGVYSIGVDSNQNHMHPGSVLTSMLKRVDVATFNCLQSAMDGTWEAGHQEMGLAEEGVGYAVDEHNEALLTQEDKDLIAAASEAIIGGELVVERYQQ